MLRPHNERRNKRKRQILQITTQRNKKSEKSNENKPIFQTEEMAGGDQALPDAKPKENMAKCICSAIWMKNGMMFQCVVFFLQKPKENNAKWGCSAI